MDTVHESIDGIKLAPKKFDSISDARSFMDRMNRAPNFTLYGQHNWVNQFIHERYPNEIDYDDSLIKIGYIDIETDSETGFPNVMEADKEINAITLIVNGECYCWGLKPVNVPDGVKYFHFETEMELLQHFVRIWEQLKLDAISGWNSQGFDMAYIVRRLTRIFSMEKAKRLSVWGIVKPRLMKSYRGTDIEVFDIFGLIDLDYLPAFKKFRPPSLNPDDNRLDTIAHVVLGEKKLDYSEYGSLRKLYRENPQLFYEYNIKDTKLVQRMEDKLNIIKLMFNMAYSAKVNIQDCYRPTAVWDSIIYGYLFNKNKIPHIPKGYEASTGQFTGALVKEPPIGRYKWVQGFDLTSLYPSIFLQTNIGPDTIRDSFDVDLNSLIDGKPHGYEQYLKDNNLSMSASGVTFTKDFTSFIVEIVQMFFDKRQMFKKKMLAAKKDLEAVKAKTHTHKTKQDELDIKKHSGDVIKYDIYQQNTKILINAFYGASGNEGFRYFDLRIAESITKFGQVIIKTGERAINKYLNKITGLDLDWIVASDTDSLIINLEPLIRHVKLMDRPNDKIVEFIVKFGTEKIQPVLDKAFRELGDKMNSFQHKLHMKQEKVCSDLVIMRKKRYLYYVLANEGVVYDEPKIEITGLEAVRTVVPEFCRNKLKEYYKLVLTGSEAEMQSFVDKVRDDFFHKKFDEIASPKGCKGLTKYGDSTLIYRHEKGAAVPIHTRAALLYNHYLRKMNLDTQYETILEGEKIKFCYLKMPNPIGENVIAAPRMLPPEMGLDEYIDYETQFQKTFLAPIDAMNTVVGWEKETRTTLEGLFV
jgi:DNA polymerase elongation subunit (family B)